MGDPVDWLWGDPESFADLFTKYYTDCEPESLLVAENDAGIVGYLSGCVDSGRASGTAAAVVNRLVLRGALVRPSIASFFWRSLWDIIRDRGAPPETLHDARWPAHLHINLLPEGRGKGLGRQLMETWHARLRARQAPGVHLGTMAENHNALRFFGLCGFARHGQPVRVPGFRTRDGRRMHVQWMTCSL